MSVTRIYVKIKKKQKKNTLARSTYLKKKNKNQL